MRPLTEKQLQCLRDAALAWAKERVNFSERCIGGWNYGSTTIARLKRDGLIIRAVDPVGWTYSGYMITEAGRQYLAAVSS